MPRFIFSAIWQFLFLLVFSNPTLGGEKTSNVVFLYQPLATPGCVLGAVIKRDQILRKEIYHYGLTLEVNQRLKDMMQFH